MRGDGSCICPDAVGDSFTVAYLPSWGDVSDASLAFTELQNNWMSYGLCAPVFISVAPGFTAADIAATGAHVVLVSNPGGGTTQYSAMELDAVRSHVEAGDSGFVTTYLLRFDVYDNSAIADLGGVEPTTLTNTNSVACNPAIDVLDAGHPLAIGLPASFDLVPVFPEAASPNVAWSSALVDPAEIVASSDDGLNVAIAYEGDAWRGVTLSTFTEYNSTAGGRQLLYNALLWASSPPS